MPGSGQEALPDDRECLGVLTKCPVVFGRHARISGSGQVALSDVQEWSGDPAECSGGVGSPPGCPGGFADVWEWWGHPPGSHGRPSRMSRSGRRPTWISGSGREACPDFWQ